MRILYFQLLIMLLPSRMLGQGFYLEKSFLLSSIDPSEIVEYSVIYDPFEFKIKLQLFDSSKIWDPITNTLTTIDHDIYAGTELLHNEHFISIQDDKVIDLKLEQGEYKKVRSIKLPQKIRERNLIVTQAFKDKEHKYFVAYYNNFNAKNGYDVLYILKLNKKNKVQKIREIDIGGEILLAPFGFQNVAFNSREFLVASVLNHQLYVIDNDLNIRDTINLATGYEKENNEVFDKAFPGEVISHYMHKPKDVIDHAERSGVLYTSLLKKIVFINDSVIAYTLNKEFRKTHTVVFYNVKSKRVIREVQGNYLDNDFYSHMAFNNKLYINELAKFGVIDFVQQNDTSESLRLRVYGMATGKQISAHQLDSFQLMDHAGNTIDPLKFDAVLITDPSFCKGCYNSFGTGERVLVIKSTQQSNKAALYTEYKFFKKNWNINGELILVDEETYEKLVGLISVNRITMIKS